MTPTPITAIYPGTFDPITRGHEDIIARACALFPVVIVAVAIAHHKKTMFTLDERLSLVREALAHLGGVRVEPFDGLVRDFARAQRASVMVRGVRGVTDFDYEVQLAGMNRHLAPEVDTVFLSPSDGVRHISSTLVREIAMLGQDADVAALVSPGVQARLADKRAKRGS